MSTQQAGTFARPRLGIFVSILSFVALVVVLTGAVITGLSYLQTRRAASEIAVAALDDAVQRVTGQASSFFSDANLLVDLHAHAPRVTEGGDQIEPLLISIFRGLRRTPQVASLYAGYESGDFWEVFSFGAQDAAFLAALGGPPGARYAVQRITSGGDGVRRESWRFFDSDLATMVTRSALAPAYDPRARGWYLAARAQPDRLIRTPPYLFASGGRAGTTIAEAFDVGSRGVVGLDVTFDQLSQFLAAARARPQHRLVLFGEQGAVLASADLAGKPPSEIAMIRDLADPVVHAVAARFDAAGPFVAQTIEIDGEEYLASVVRMPETDLAIAADFLLTAARRADFEGSLAGAAEADIIGGFIVLVIALPVIAYLARRVSKPIDEAQRAMEAAKELAEGAARVKSEFLASMSHEIRTPLNGVLGMADLLTETPLDEDQRHMLTTIRESGNALLGVINDILDFSKIEAGKLGIEHLPMSIADAVEGVAGTLAPAARAKGIRIHCFVDPAIPAALLGDPVRIRQILFNLIGNALKFSEGRDVAVRAVALATESDSCRVRFEVADQGIGISEENQGKLFLAFSQAESSTTRRFGGTGLGLAICKRLVDMMGGSIGLTSRLGAGSTFFFELSLVPAPAGRAGEPVRDLSGLNVLLVASPSPRAETIAAYLAHWGARHAAACDEDEALAMCADAKVPFDSAIVDLDLDAERQEDFARRFVARDPSRTRLILLQDFQRRGARIADGAVTVDVNPLMRHRILSAVAVAAGRASPEVRPEEEEQAPSVARLPSIEEARTNGTLILLAEDNPTNQQVIARQLRRLGYVCEIAGNGVEALQRWPEGGYGLVLTDCHMPEMDGYELTGRIRAQEQAAGSRIPIVAITANALQGEGERCLAAGMDDYLIKPFTMKALRDTLSKWLPTPEAAGEDRAVAPSAPLPARAEPTILPVDARVLKEMFGEDEATFAEILGSFVEPSCGIMQAIAAARQGREGEAVTQAAHQLKSSARAIGANALADSCAELEAAGRAGDWAAIDRLAVQAEAQMQDVLRYIDELAKPRTEDPAHETTAGE